MQQIIQSYRTGELWLGDVPAPALRSGGAIVRTAASLVSAGTERMVIELAKKSLLGKARARPDLVAKVIRKIKTEGFSQTMAKVSSKLDTPIPLGYSSAGTIAEVGAAAGGFKVGDRVACAGAGYATHAEFNYIPKNLLVTIPDAVSFDDAAFTTLGAIAMQGVRQADMRLGERVVVIGLGLLGLLTVQMLKASGCLVLGSDPDASRCRLAKELGADDAGTIDLIDAAAAFTLGRGADAVIITAATPSNAPVEIAAEIARQRGRVVIVGLVGMNIPREPFYKKELELRLSMSYGPGRYDPSYEEAGHDYPFGYVRWTEQRNMESFLDLVASGRVTPSKLVTHHYAIGDALNAYELLESRSEPYLGIIITYPQQAASSRIEVSDRVVRLRELPASQRIGIGLIGAGGFGKGVLLPALKRVGGMDVDLVGICTSSGMSGTETGKKNGFAYATTDPAQLFADDRIHAVFIATRHDTHAQLACAALDSGKHVFVEKPLCLKREDLALYDAALQRRAGSLLMVGFNRRFSPHAIAVREAFAGRTTPAVVNYRVNAGAVLSDSWTQDNETGGGRLIGEACHFVDLCEFLIGSSPTNVYAASIASNDARVRSEDSTSITIRYADGSIATIQFVALGSPDLPKERIEIFAGGAAAVIDDFSQTTFYGIRRRALKTRQDKGIDAEVGAFLGALRTITPPIPISSMLRTTELMFQIHDSLRTGESISCLTSSPATSSTCLSSEPSEQSDTSVRVSS